MRNKVTTAAKAVSLIRDGDTICTSGFVGVGAPDDLLLALERRFLDTASPRDLSLVYAAGQGDGKDRGLNIIAHEGLLKRVIGGHWGLVPKMVKLATDEKIEGYNLPIGAISHMYRDTAAGKPGMLSRIGIGTFVDPRVEGGKLNKRTTEDLVSVMQVDGREWLFYRAVPMHVALIRATFSDPEGNVSATRECLDLDALSQAMAVKNSGGIVIVQVEQIVGSRSIKPRDVLIPGVLVDCVVVADPANHRQTYKTAYNPAFSGEISVPVGSHSPAALDLRKIIARRCAMELRPGAIVNLGIGMPEGVAGIAAEEGVDTRITLTTEAGVIGGIPLSGLDFGAALNAEAIIHQNQQFDFYDGGGLDLAFLGMAETDAQGNVNVSRFGDKIAGAGGFINITQTARRLVYCGTFSTGKPGFTTGDGRLRLSQDDGTCKFRDGVAQMTFNGPMSVRAGQSVIYVTERCVFELTSAGLELIEIAPGIDIERDILARMPFRPIVNAPRQMDARIFRDAPMGLIGMLDLSLHHRITHDAARNRLSVNLEGLHIRTAADLATLRSTIEAVCDRIGHPVDAVVNYDSFDLAQGLEGEFARMATELGQTRYARVARHASNAFVRLRLSQVLAGLPPLFATRHEAQATQQPVAA